MTIEMFLYCGLVALIGALLHFLIAANDVQKTSLKANVQFSLGQYFRDQKLSIFVSLGTITLALLTGQEWLNWNASVMGWKNSIFAFVGFSSDYIANYIFGVAKKRLIAAIDFKTTELDKANGTLNAPTPAVLPGDKKP